MLCSQTFIKVAHLHFQMLLFPGYHLTLQHSSTCFEWGHLTVFNIHVALSSSLIPRAHEHTQRALIRITRILVPRLFSQERYCSSFKAADLKVWMMTSRNKVVSYGIEQLREWLHQFGLGEEPNRRASPVWVEWWRTPRVSTPSERRFRG